MSKSKSFYLAPSTMRMTTEFREGVKTGSKCRISDLEKIFCWMPGFLNCFTGFAGRGKTTFVMFLMLVKSIIDGWRWGIWSPEMIDSVRTDKGIERTANKIYNSLIHAYTGKNPYKHHANQMSMEEYIDAKELIEKYFFVIDTGKDKKPGTVIGAFNKLYDEFGCNGFLIDPFKNLTIEESGGTKDRILEAVFDDFEDLALSTDSVMNFIAHPKNMSEKEAKNGNMKGPYKLIKQNDLLGGSVWDNSMDGIFSWDRPEVHIDQNSPLGRFYSLKQRSQEVTTRLGSFEDIYYSFEKNVFYFNNVNPIDGSVRIPVQAGMFNNGSSIDFSNKKKKEPERSQSIVITNEDDLPF